MNHIKQLLHRAAHELLLKAPSAHKNTSQGYGPGLTTNERILHRMREGLDEPVSVLSIYSEKKKQFRPMILTWKGIDYRLGTVDFYNKTKQGLTTLHHFSLADKNQSIYFKLLFNATTLSWTIEEYMMAGENNPHYASA